MPEPEKRIRNGKVRWYARHYNPNGKRHTKVFDTKAAADQFDRRRDVDDHRQFCRPQPEQGDCR